MLSKRLMVMRTTVMFAHADLAVQCSTTYQVLLETTTSVTQVFKITGGVVYSIQTIPSGMDRAAACNLIAAGSTPRRGSVRNSLTLPLMTLKSGSALIKATVMKTLPLN